MKPLLNVEAFLKRFNHFKDGEVRSLEVLSPTTMLITLAGQDEARAFDWVSVNLEFSNISDAQLIEDSKLSLIKMSEGISIIKSTDTLAFGIGECKNEAGIKSSTCFIIASNIKFEEENY